MNRKEIGRAGEDIAANYLIQNGFLIVDRNFYSRFGEIDIIASKDSDIIFVEVKLRKNIYYGRGCEAVNYHKQEKIKNTALEFIRAKNILDKNFRFDVIDIILKPKLEINHIVNAFGF